jgi:hypothetical protein
VVRKAVRTRRSILTAADRIDRTLTASNTQSGGLARRPTPGWNLGMGMRLGNNDIDRALPRSLRPAVRGKRKAAKAVCAVTVTASSIARFAASRADICRRPASAGRGIAACRRDVSHRRIGAGSEVEAALVGGLVIQVRPASEHLSRIAPTLLGASAPWNSAERSTFTVATVCFKRVDRGNPPAVSTFLLFGAIAGRFSRRSCTSDAAPSGGCHVC